LDDGPAWRQLTPRGGDRLHRTAQIDLPLEQAIARRPVLHRLPWDRAHDQNLLSTKRPGRTPELIGEADQRRYSRGSLSRLSTAARNSDDWPAKYWAAPSISHAQRR